MRIDATLLEALKSPAFYVGALGSKKNNDARGVQIPETIEPQKVKVWYWFRK